MIQRFSVVVPLYNKREYVRRAVDSVLDQTHRAFELIIVDDGSTDGSHEMLASVNDERFRLVRQANAGEGAARNRGLAEAREDWVAFLDADDLWLPHHLAETAKIVAAFPDSGFVATGFREVTDVREVNAIGESRANIRRIDYFIEASRRIGRVNASNVSVRRAAIMNIDGFGRYKAGGDLDCWARLALLYPAALSDRVTSAYVRGTGGVMEQLQQTQSDARVAVTALRLEDISPSVASLCRAIEVDPAIGRRRGVHAYLNARAFSCVYGALGRGDVPAAASYLKLITYPYSTSIAVVSALFLLPCNWLGAAIPFARRLKNSLRRESVARPRAS
jgi:glycosyltransferase involved in cell wall biosynthesis